MFQANDLKWTKSVTRAKGTMWAYIDYQAGDFFDLNCSEINGKNMLKPQIGDLILIFQSYEKVTYLTHLVTPVEVKTDIDIKSPAFPITRKMFVVASAQLVKPKVLDFKGPNRGKICPLTTIKDYGTKEKIELYKLQDLVFNLFDKKLLDSKEIIKESFGYSLDIDEVDEGKKNERLRWHKYYERNPWIIAEAKKRAKESNKFFCEVCSFNFETYYPIIGNGFIECHHITPISQGGIRKTRIKDLAIVCSNCHRMLHRKGGDGLYPTIEKLKSIIDNIIT